MPRGKKLSIDEQLAKAEQEVARLKALKDTASIKEQILALVNECTEASKLNKVLKILQPKEAEPKEVEAKEEPAQEEKAE